MSWSKKSMKTVDFFSSMPENKIAVQNFSLIFVISEWQIC